MVIEPAYSVQNECYSIMAEKNAQQIVKFFQKVLISLCNFYVWKMSCRATQSFIKSLKTCFSIPLWAFGFNY